MSEKRFLSRSDILDADDQELVELEVKEWGGWLRVRGLSGTERDYYEQKLIVGRGRKRDIKLANARARLVAMCVVDEKGRRLFSKEDISNLGKKSAAALQRVYEVAAALSGLSDDDLEELVGNSEETLVPGGDSSIDTLESSD